MEFLNISIGKDVGVNALDTVLIFFKSVQLKSLKGVVPPFPVLCIFVLPT